MKGLLIKDLRLMAAQKKFFLSLVLVTVLLVIMAQDASFIICYMSFIGAQFSLSTISYDEFDNGNAFLFSLPITRKGYVVEKYGFGLLMGGGCWLFSMLAAMVGGEIRKLVPANDTLMVAILILPIMLLVVAVMLPFQLKFGGEKGRIAIFVIVGVVAAAIFVGLKMEEALGINFNGFLSGLQELGFGALATVLAVAAIVVLLISGRVSMAILEKKEF